jgi:hypothetical protein
MTEILIIIDFFFYLYYENLVMKYKKIYKIIEMFNIRQVSSCNTIIINKNIFYNINFSHVISYENIDIS